MNFKCPECIARKRKEKEDTAKRTNVAKILDDTPALEEKIKTLKGIILGLKHICQDGAVTIEGEAFCCRIGKEIEDGLAL